MSAALVQLYAYAYRASRVKFLGADRIMVKAIYNRRCFVVAGGSCLAAIPLAAGGRNAHAAPRADLWPRWQQHQAENTDAIDHGAWNDLLGRLVRVDNAGVARFPYASLAASDRNLLDLYIQRMAAISPS
ncbi:MAG: hypothetical protein AAF556_08325, partial [Pseudomonadota bacterium]